MQMFFSSQNPTSAKFLPAQKVALGDTKRDKRSSSRSEMKYSEQEIPDGDAGVDVTIEHMKEMATEDANLKSIKDLAKKLRRKTDWETVKSIFQYVQKNVRYEHDPEDKELLIRPRHVLSKTRPFGDCDDMTMALAALYLASGFHVRFRTIEWKNDEKTGEPIPFFTHVYPLVYVKSVKAWIPTDAVIEEGGGLGNEQGVIRRRKDYPITLNDISMATLARLDDRIRNNRRGLRDGEAPSGNAASTPSQSQCCGKKKKRPIVLNINNSNANNINAGNTTNTTRNSSPEVYAPSRSNYQEQYSPRTQTQIAPRSNSQYSPRSQYQSNPKNTEYYSPRTQSQYAPKTNTSVSANRPGYYSSPSGQGGQNPQQSPASAPPENRPQPGAQPSQGYGVQPSSRPQAPSNGFMPSSSALPTPDRNPSAAMTAPAPPPGNNFAPSDSNSFAPAPPPGETPQANTMRPPPREFDANPQYKNTDGTTPSSGLRPPPREFDANPQYKNTNDVAQGSTMRPPPREFDANPHYANTNSAEQPSGLRPPPREFDANPHYANTPQASTMRPPPREFDANPHYVNTSHNSGLRPPPREFS
jgi:hypothetical protein